MSCSVRVAWLTFDFMKRKKKTSASTPAETWLTVETTHMHGCNLAAGLEKEIRRHRTTEANNIVKGRK